MRILKKIQPLQDFILLCEFRDGVVKTADIKPYLNCEAFLPLNNFKLFSNIKNHEYYVSWMNGEVDLSADTLWHIGETCSVDKKNERLVS